MKDFTDLLKQLEEENSGVAWTGPDGLMFQAAQAIRYLQFSINHTKSLDRLVDAKIAHDEGADITDGATDDEK